MAALVESKVGSVSLSLALRVITGEKVKYRKKPVEIEAMQLSWDNWNAICQWIGPFKDGMRGVYVDPKTGLWSIKPDFPNSEIGMLIPTLEGTMLAREGDYIIRGVKGEYYPCKPDIFSETYDVT